MLGLERLGIITIIVIDIGAKYESICSERWHGALRAYEADIEVDFVHVSAGGHRTTRE